jgi:tetratricopeptide (TPR) repeat protein
MIMVVSQTAGIQDGTTAQLAFQRGLLLRADGRTADAAAAFRTAAEHLDSPSPGQLYRAGNAWFLAGELPRAIFAYRRGLALDPADAKLRQALDFARNQVNYPTAAELLHPESELWPRRLVLRSFGLYAFALYCVACASLARWRMVALRMWLTVGVISFILAAVPAVGSTVKWWQTRRDVAEPIVVVVRDIPLRAGNGADYATKAELPLGCEVRRLFERNGWLQLQTGGGLIGWVPPDAVVN